MIQESSIDSKDRKGKKKKQKIPVLKLDSIELNKSIDRDKEQDNGKNNLSSVERPLSQKRWNSFTFKKHKAVKKPINYKLSPIQRNYQPS
jgi:hypothetical protein